ncbi:ABC transporter [Microbacterium invictum]|uniref:Uncharacterized protein n=1 Tax=Microbacterium invictum TaxID=515415 RepID=A0AA40SPW5_9MICO|nr:MULTISPECIES: ABC transporter [Microbacterium]MBB4140156.1 hypothetical protein [Microbacterium invictum]
MSDPNYGEPVDDNTTGEAGSVDDVVGRAHEGLAEAEAASRDAVSEEELARVDAGDAAPSTASAADSGTATADAAATGSAATATDPAASDTASAAAPAGHDADLDAAYAEAGYVPGAAATVATPTAAEPSADTTAVAGTDATGPDAVTTAYDGTAYGDAVTPSEPVATGAAAGVAYTASPQPIFVQAPEAPRPRGNRGAAGAIGLLAAVSFGILYLAAALGFGLADGSITGENVGTEAVAALTTWWFWVPVVVFFLGFWLLGAIINRGRWGYWVIFGLLVGAVSYGGHLLGQLFQAPFWELTAREGAELVDGQLLAPLAIVAFIFGRELTIWFGAWVSARGKRVTELNYEAQREYERTLEAGPQLHQG